MTAVVRGDALRLPLRDESVDLIVTSPPYFALRSYQDDGGHYAGQIGSEPTPQAFLEALWAVTAECVRVLKPSGSMFVNLGDKYSGAGGPGGDYNKGGLRDGQPRIDAQSYWSRMAPANSGIPAKSLMLIPEAYRLGCNGMLAALGGIDTGLRLRARAVLVWSKPNGLPESVTDRVRRSHEDWVHLTREPRYFSAVDEIREPASGYERPNRAARATAPGQRARALADTCNPLGKLPGSVWPLDYDWWEVLRSGPIVFCPRCGRDLRAGPGRATRPHAGTVGSPSPAAASSTPTVSPTSSPSDPSPTGSPSTTSAATEGAAGPTTSKSSPDARTSSEAVSPSRPTASTATPSPTPTSTGGPAASIGSAVPATRNACVCEMLDFRPSGVSSVWTVPSEPLIVPEWLGVDHFAGFPQELPRRLILGWSPSGICVACGEGRRPVVDKELDLDHHQKSNTGRRDLTEPDGNERGMNGAHPNGRTVATITGYACACPDTSAPTRPAVILDPFGGTGTVAMVARALGRVGVNIDLSADYCRLARWRIYDSGHAAKSRERTNRQAQGALL